MGYYLLLIVPLIPFTISLFLGGVAWAWKRYVGRRFIGHLSLDIMCDTDGKVEAYFLSCLKQSIPFLGCVYNNICLKSFATFQCTQLRDGTWVLGNAPSMVCYESYGHNVMTGIAILALIVYVFGLPFFTFASTYYLHYYDMLKDPKPLLVLGIYYREYGAALTRRNMHQDVQLHGACNSTCNDYVPRIW